MAKIKDEEKTGVPALIVTPEKAPVVSGNFQQIEKFLQGWKKKVLSMELTEENMEEARVVKKEAVQFRNSLSKIQTDVKKLYFNDPKAVFDAQMSKLLAVVGEVEKAVDDVLAKEEKERIDSINEVLDHYKKKFQEQYNLTSMFLDRIEYKKSYYNKTADEKARKDDLEAQFKELKKEQAAYDGNIRLVKAACKDEPRLNCERYIRDLSESDVASVLEEIEGEKARLHELAVQPTETAQAVGLVQEAVGKKDSASEETKVVLGIPADINFNSDFPGRTRTMKVEISYPCDLGDALTELFKSIRPYGIKVKRLVEETAF